jgi:moderate conductance mechanosensitive channel
MEQLLASLVRQQETPSALVNAAVIAAYLLGAILVSLFSRRLARPLVLLGRRMPGKPAMAPSRQHTLESLVGSLISLLAFVIALFGAFSFFVESERLIWIVGLFSAAFGLGARSLVADILAGMRFIFRNTFTIGEKVELAVGATKVEGTVEEVNVTNTLVRSTSGEANIVPNGDIVVITNFSRASHSSAKIKLFVRSAQLATALDALGQTALDAQESLPDILEPFQVLSTSDTMGHKIELTIMAHCLYAKAATIKLRLMDLVYRRLTEAGVEVMD